MATAAGRKGTMAKEICISSTPHETRLAILEDDQLAEIYYERENEYTLAGSIYNGRVTRVLPGMQSAFVDLGLERDAFLYVTDFLEMEDPEESDELERAAASGGNQPPREVRSPNGHAGERSPRESRPESRSESSPESRPDARSDQRGTRADRDRGGRDRRPAPESGADMTRPDQPGVDPVSPQIPSLTGEVDTGEESEGGAKRWRGRRRRRGGRSAPETVADPVETEASAETYLEPSQISPPEMAPDIQASAGMTAEAPTRAPRADRSDRAPAPFVLPGESLSKYGGEPAADSPKPEFQASLPTRPASGFKPASLIESPIEWDGSGLLPGESISRHRSRGPEANASIEPALQPQAPDTEQYLDTEQVVQEEQPEESLLGASARPLVPEATVPEHGVADPFASDPFFVEKPSSGYSQEEHTGEPQEYSDDFNSGLSPVEPVIHEPDANEPVAEPTHILSTDPDRPEPESSESEGHEQETDRSASHHVDPRPPSGFRLFGFGGKKKADAAGPRIANSRSRPRNGDRLFRLRFCPRHGPRRGRGNRRGRV